MNDLIIAVTIISGVYTLQTSITLYQIKDLKEDLREFRNRFNTVMNGAIYE